MTLRGFLFWAALIVTFLVVAVWSAEAKAHGPHHSFVSPAWDCHEGIEGDIAVTHDLDRNRYVRWRCVCVWTQMGYKVCYWRITYVVQLLKNMPISSLTKHYGQARIVTRRVHWMAWHGSNGCVEHFARRSVIVVKHR